MEKKKENAYLFLTIGKTQESRETQEFKRYVGIASSYVLAVNPKKAELDKLTGFESTKDPEYVVDGDNGREARITFIVKTDPESTNSIEIVNRLMFVLRATPAYNRDQTKVQVIDKYGNSTWANVEDAKAGKRILTSDGNPARIDAKYRMACVGEADLIDFLRVYLGVSNAFNYVNGVWVLKDNADECQLSLDHIKDYFNGDVSELREALALQPNNKIKLLYGVRTTETDQGTREYQSIATRGDFFLPNNAGSRAYERVEKRLADAKAAGSFSNTVYKVQELQEWTVQPTNLEKPVEDTTSEMPWD